ncbi:SGNH/GDSL hydrolase family protein [Dyadobacter sp. CY261]|uniref:SGNH/GDSL hydrolase family protein n=1 Tax=Dyadobacter sp. CY261 TaxID=2907203 RepID=UPI001F15CDCF|nr:SGNH/GDSL hydrolase family protein [Dyadobacter sp. CY261]MCF0075435.1 SGNH/GDSL hydrolase family protein [Dyadobacter sp. CY261]
MLKTFGDSIPNGYGVPSGQGWVGLMTPINSARNGDMAGDMSNLIHGVSGGSAVVPDPSTVYAMMIGANDHRTYKGAIAKQAHFKNLLRACIAWLVLPTKVKARDPGVVYTGSWSNTSVNAYGKFSQTQNSTAEFTVSGESIYIGYIIQNHVGSVSQAEVRVDGVLVGTISSDGNTAPVNTMNGAQWAMGCSRFDGLAPGSHTVNIKVVSPNGKTLFVDYVAGSDQVSTPKIALSNVIRQSVAGYTASGSSDAIVDQYNVIIDDLISEFTTDGLNIVKVDNHATINPASHLLPDGLHPNSSGHIVISNNFQTVV